MRYLILQLGCFLLASGSNSDNLHHDRKCPITKQIFTLKKSCTEYKKIKIKPKKQFKAKYRDQSGRIREITRVQRPSYKKTCVNFQWRNTSSLQTTYTCCPGWTGADCKTQYLTISTLDRLTSKISDLESKLIKSDRANRILSEKTNKLRKIERKQQDNITDLRDRLFAYELKLSEIMNFDAVKLPTPKIKEERMQADSPVLVISDQSQKSPYNQIYQDRLLSQNTLVPIMTRSDLCRLGYKTENNLIPLGTTVMCKLPVECSHYFYHPFDCCPKCCPYVDTAVMYKKSTSVLEFR